MFNEKKEILDGYKQFKKIMEKEKIWFSAYSGTAVGAVRDNGIIPWDDDIDTIITYEGYKKLLSKYPNNIIKAGDDDYPLFFPKWVPDRTKVHTSSVFVDLFLVIRTNKKKVKKFRSLKNKIHFGLYATGHKMHKPFNKKVKVLSIIAKLFRPFIRRQLDFDKIVTNLHDPHGDIHVSVVNPVEKYNYILIDNFTKEVVEYDFEDTTIPVFKTFEPFLIRRYGTLDKPDMTGKTIMEHLDAVNIHFIKYESIK